MDEIQQNASLDALFENENTVKIGASDKDSMILDFTLDPTAVAELEGITDPANPVITTTPPADPAAELEADLILVPEKTNQEVNYANKVREYTKSLKLDYDTERDLMSKVTSRESYEEIIGKMADREEFLLTNINKLGEKYPMFVPVLNNAANTLELLQDSVRQQLGDLNTEANFDTVMEKLYTNGALTEEGKSRAAKIQKAYADMHADVVAKANKYADDNYNSKKEYRSKLVEGASSTKLMGLITPNEELQKELIEEVEKGEYFDTINKMLTDEKTKVDTELLMAAIANPRLRAILTKEIYNLGVNSKKNELIKAKL